MIMERVLRPLIDDEEARAVNTVHPIDPLREERGLNRE
jgi:hypothetical protein